MNEEELMELQETVEYLKGKSEFGFLTDNIRPKKYYTIDQFVKHLKILNTSNQISQLDEYDELVDRD